MGIMLQKYQQGLEWKKSDIGRFGPHKVIWGPCLGIGLFVLYSLPIVLTICPCKEYEEEEMKKWHCCWMCRLFLVATAALAVAPIIVTSMQFQNYTHHKIKPNMYNTVQMMPEPFCRKVFHCCLYTKSIILATFIKEGLKHRKNCESCPTQVV